HRSVRNMSIKRTGPLAEELTYKDEAAAGYDRAVARVTTHFVPFLLRAAHVAPGMRVLDIATGTGLAAEAALRLVGTTGHVTAAALLPAMVDKARRRLGNAPNASLAVEDGQALSYSDESFNAVICSLGLMLFPDPSRGLAEFRRVLRSKRQPMMRRRICFNPRKMCGRPFTHIPTVVSYFRFRGQSRHDLILP